MYTNPNAITVLCYGDSNTHGSRPDKQDRYAPNIRWTGVLQKGLGEGYYVIEEGLGGRTTDLEFPGGEGRNGRQYLLPCLETHNPVDIVILMLGTNDLKDEFNRSAEDVAKAISQLVADIQQIGISKQAESPRIIIVSPIHIAEFIEDVELGTKYRDPAYKKSLQLADHFKKVARVRSVEFFDAASVAVPGEDAIHIDEKGHKALGEALTKVVLSR